VGADVRHRHRLAGRRLEREILAAGRQSGEPEQGHAGAKTPPDAPSRRPIVTSIACSNHDVASPAVVYLSWRHSSSFKTALELDRRNSAVSARCFVDMLRQHVPDIEFPAMTALSKNFALHGYTILSGTLNLVRIPRSSGRKTTCAIIGLRSMN
jgi:hypothetical protein